MWLTYFGFWGLWVGLLIRLGLELGLGLEEFVILLLLLLRWRRLVELEIGW